MLSEVGVSGYRYLHRSSREVLRKSVGGVDVSTITHGGIGQLSKLPSNWPVTDCHRGIVMLDLSAD